MPAEVVKIAIPANLEFAELNLTRTPDGDIEFDWAPIERICAESGLDIALFRDQHEDNANVSGLIVSWYAEHLARGGARDAVSDELLAEVMAEDEHGGGISHQPGRA